MKRHNSKQFGSKARKLLRKFSRGLTELAYDLRRHLAGFFNAVLSIARFWRRRNARFLVQGLPAAIALLGAIGLLISSEWNSISGLILEYQQFADENLQAKHFDAARIAYARLAMLDGRPDFRYGLALAADGLGQRERALALMESLAPRNAPGFGPAHYWLAATLLSKPDSAPLPVVVRHLQQATRLASHADQAHAMLGALYLQAKRLDDAERHLLLAADTRPNVGLMLADLYRQRGQKVQAQAWADRSARYFEAQVQADPANPSAQISWAEALLFLGEPDRAVSILEEGFAASQADLYRPWIGRAYLASVDSIKGNSAEDRQKRLSLIERGLRFHSNDMGLLQRLITESRRDGTDNEKSKALLERLQVEGKCSATLNLLLGMQALESGQQDTARTHLERAYRLDPNLPTLGNNLAWMLAFSDPPQLPRALKMVNSVLARDPRNLHAFETRGQIYVKMGQWKEALADLQIALPAFPQDPNLHRAMAESYRQLGNLEMAAQHQKIVDARKP